MRTKILIGVLLLFTQFGFSQNSPKSESKKTEMEQTQFLGLRTTIYKVGNITEAKQWYSKAFKTKPYVDESYYVGFNIGGFELGLQPEENPTTDKTESVVAYWGVDNIQESYDRLIKIGAIENEKPYNVGGELMTATVKDPFGNVIGLIYNPYFELKD
ncbi:MAG: VOC family protein [Flavobacteriaceae bacterium]